MTLVLWTTVAPGSPPSERPTEAADRGRRNRGARGGHRPTGVRRPAAERPRRSTDASWDDRRRVPRTSPTALAFLQEGLQHCPSRVRWAGHLPEPLWKLARTEVNKSGTSQLEEMGRDRGLVAADRNDLGDRFTAFRHDHFLARLDASQVLAQSRLELGHCGAPHQLSPLIRCM